MPSFLPDPAGITGTVYENFVFEGEEVPEVPNPSLGKWYRDRDNSFYWGGALNVYEEPVDEHAPELLRPDNEVLEKLPITPGHKKKIEQVVNVFETGKKEGDYSQVSVFADYSDPETRTRIRQVTFGRSQTTEFGHLKDLIREYIDNHGKYANDFLPFMSQIGKKPSLESKPEFRELLKKAGREDPVMRFSQDKFFDGKYYQPAFNWFSTNGFTQPLSLLIVYDSYIHSGCMLAFLRKRFPTPTPVNGGDEKEWMGNYVNARHDWLTNHSDKILRNTNYRTNCFKEQMRNNNWDLSRSINAHDIIIT